MVKHMEGIEPEPAECSATTRRRESRHRKHWWLERVGEKDWRRFAFEGGRDCGEGFSKIAEKRGQMTGAVTFQTSESTSIEYFNCFEKKKTASDFTLT